MYDCILLRYGEIGLKSSRVRKIFERQYVDAIKDALDRNGFSDYKIDNLGGRFVLFYRDADKLVEVLSRIPGIQSFSPATIIDFKSKQGLIDNVEKLAKKTVEGKTFRVKVRRNGSHKFTSMELASEIGEALYDYSKGVDLHTPEVIVSLEVRNNTAYLFTESFDGVGGLPPKSGGKVLCLFSGGIDSPVAAFQMLKKGCEVNFLFINLLGEKSFNEVAKIYNYLISQYAFNYKPKLFVVNAVEIVETIRKKVDSSLRQIALKIAFYKLAELVVAKEHYSAVITGEGLSQKSSQTIKSLKVIQSQTSDLIVRPLIALDKIEITKIARKIGTFHASEKVKEYCNLSEGAVTTSPHESVLRKIIPLDNLVKKGFESLKKYEGLVTIDEDVDVKLKSLKNLVSVDVRSGSMQRRQPLKTDLRIPFDEVYEKTGVFEKDKKYLLVCDFGVKSEEIAFTFRKRGIKAAGISITNFSKYFSKKK